jgi:ATP/ADP translocase
MKTYTGIILGVHIFLNHCLIHNQISKLNRKKKKKKKKKKRFIVEALL